MADTAVREEELELELELLLLLLGEAAIWGDAGDQGCGLPVEHSWVPPALSPTLLSQHTCCREVLGVMKASGVISLGLVSLLRLRKSAGAGNSTMRRRSGWEPWGADPRPSEPSSGRDSPNAVGKAAT